MTATCPKCQQKLKIKAEDIGRDRRCPVCRTKISVPASSSRNGQARVAVSCAASEKANGFAHRQNGTAKVNQNTESCSSRVWAQIRKAGDRINWVHDHLENSTDADNEFDGETVLAEARGLRGVHVFNPLAKYFLKVCRFAMTLLGSRTITKMYVTRSRLVFVDTSNCLFGVWGRSKTQQSISIRNLVTTSWTSNTRLLHLLQTHTLEIEMKSGRIIAMHLDTRNDEDVRELADLISSLTVKD